MGMPTVPWHELDGERAERFISILLLREYPDGHRRRATQGDGGIDVVVPVSDNPHIVDIYQIKKFYQPITSDNKTKIAKSITRFMETVEKEGLAVRQWHLTLPVNGSADDLRWLEGKLSSTKIVARWKGLEFLEGLCARYRDVVDYYILGGQERLHELVRMAMLMQIPSTPAAGEAGVNVEAIFKTLEPTFLKLNADDPHYRYNLAMLHEADVDFRSAPPSAVMSQFFGASDQPVLRVDVFPLYAQATEDRPITSTIRFSVPGDNAEVAEAIQNFRVFGDDISLPGEFASVAVDDPLSGVVESQPMNVNIWTPARDEERRVRFLVAEPDGTRVASAFFNVERLTQGPSGKGFTATLLSDSKLIRIVQRSASPDAPIDTAGTTTFSINLDWSDKVAAGVLEDIRYARTMTPPRKLVFALEFTGPYLDAVSFANRTGAVVPDWLYRYTTALAALQDYANVPLRLHRADTEAEVEKINQTLRIASLLEGHIIGQSSPMMGVQLDVDDLSAAVEMINETEGLRISQPFTTEVSNGSVSIPDAVFTFSDVSASLGAVQGVEQVLLSPRTGEEVVMRVWLQRFEPASPEQANS